MKTKTKMRLMQFGGIVISFAPLAVEIAVNHELYFATKEAGWSMTIGGIIAIFLVAMAMLGKIGKMFGSDIKVVGMIFLLSCLLKPILLNLQWLSGLLFAGIIVSKIIFNPQVKKLQKRMSYEEQADVLKEVLRDG